MKIVVLQNTFYDGSSILIKCLPILNVRTVFVFLKWPALSTKRSALKVYGSGCSTINDMYVWLGLDGISVIIHLRFELVWLYKVCKIMWPYNYLRMVTRRKYVVQYRIYFRNSFSVFIRQASMRLDLHINI